jgi:hypothetical protein
MHPTPSATGYAYQAIIDKFAEDCIQMQRNLTAIAVQSLQPTAKAQGFESVGELQAILNNCQMRLVDISNKHFST